MHISVTKCCIVGYLSDAMCDLLDGKTWVISTQTSQKTPTSILSSWESYTVYIMIILDKTD